VPKPLLSAAFGEILRSRRLSAGLTQEALAERAEVHPTYVGLVERGQRNPTLDVANQLAEALGCTLAAMIAQAAGMRTASRQGGRKQK